MRKILVIARHEFFATVTRLGYILMVIGMPLFLIAIGGVGFWTGSSAERSATPKGPVGVIDHADVIDFSLAETLGAGSEPGEAEKSFGTEEIVEISQYTGLDQALTDLREGRLSACYLLEADYPATGKMTVYTGDTGLFSNLVTPGRGQLHRLIRASLVKGQVRGQHLERLLDPSHLDKMKVTKQGDVRRARSEFEELGEIAGPFGMFLLLTMAIFFSSGYLLQGIAEEKQNRVIEVLLSSATPTELLAGKILGLGAAGLLQVGIYMALLFVPAMTLLASFNLSVTKLIVSVVYFILGYLLFASLMAATGVVGNTVQESSQLSAIWTMTSMIPMFLIGPLSADPNSLLAKGLSFFPLTAPVTMLLRLSGGDVPWTDVLISIGVLIVGILLAVRGAAKIFRASSLMYGKRPSVPEIVRWLREA